MKQKKIGRTSNLTAAGAFQGDLTPFPVAYAQQPKLTARLDLLGDSALSQNLINEMVLWKVNLYVSLTPKMLEQIDELHTLKPNEHRKANSVLTGLLGFRGVDLAMASTILRFRNPAVFQIIDKRTYRAIFGSEYQLSTKSAADRKVSLYFAYLDALVELCSAKSLAFETIDRLLYKFDPAQNGKL